MMSSKTPDTHGVCSEPKGNFFMALKHDHHVHKNSLFGHLKPIPAKIAFEVGMKSKKSPPAHIFDLTPPAVQNLKAGASEIFFLT